MNIDVQLYLAEFVLEWELLQTKVVESWGVSSPLCESNTMCKIMCLFT